MTRTFIFNSIPISFLPTRLSKSDSPKVFFALPNYFLHPTISYPEEQQSRQSFLTGGDCGCGGFLLQRAKVSAPMPSVVTLIELRYLTFNRARQWMARSRFTLPTSFICFSIKVCTSWLHKRNTNGRCWFLDKARSEHLGWWWKPLILRMIPMGVSESESIYVGVVVACSSKDALTPIFFILVRNYSYIFQLEFCLKTRKSEGIFCVRRWWSHSQLSSANAVHWEWTAWLRKKHLAFPAKLVTLHMLPDEAVCVQHGCCISMVFVTTILSMRLEGSTCKDF